MEQPKNAFKEWLETEHGKLSMQPYDFTKPNQLQYLENRLWWAYTAGVANTMNTPESTPEWWVSVEDKTPELSVLYWVYDPTAVVKYYSSFYLPLPTTEKAGAFFSGGNPCFGVSHYQLPQPPKH